MLSEGGAGIDNQLWLHRGMYDYSSVSTNRWIISLIFRLSIHSFVYECSMLISNTGVLRLSLDRETYERSGLVGTPDGRPITQRGRSRWRK